MSLVDHLRELRKRLVYSLIAVGVGFGVAYNFAPAIFDFLIQPLLIAMPEGQDKRLVYTGLAQPFMLDLTLGIFGGIVLALPVILLQVWAFIAPALYPNERKFVVPIITSAMLCFAGGASFAYYVAFPVAFKYFLGYTTATIQPMISINEYLDFATKMLLGFGVMFELPLVILILARFGIVSPEFLSKNRRWAILIIAVMAALFTPPDALSMGIMAVPLYLLFEISAQLARFVYKARPVLVDEDGEFISEPKDPTPT